jgi:hypothetical protein
LNLRIVIFFIIYIYKKKHHIFYVIIVFITRCKLNFIKYDNLYINKITLLQYRFLIGIFPCLVILGAQGLKVIFEKLGSLKMLKLAIVSALVLSGLVYVQMHNVFFQPGSEQVIDTIRSATDSNSLVAIDGCHTQPYYTMLHR